MNIKRTERGFKRGEFIDSLGRICSIQESSDAGDYYIWLGIQAVDKRMHLNRKTAKALIPCLTKFVKTGRL